MEPVETFIVIVIAAVLAVVGWSAWSSSESGVITLNVSEWRCTDTRTETHLQPMLVGKITTLIPITQQRCVEYRAMAR